MYLSYKTGIGKIYSKQEIQLQKQLPSFEKEYNLRFEFGVGDIFDFEDIDIAITKKYSLAESNPYAIRYMGIDPAFASSQYGVTVIEFYDGKVNILYADSWERPLFDVAIQRILELMKRYNVCKVLVDGANPSVIKSLKHALGSSEYMNYELLEEQVIDTWITGECEYNKIVPISFRNRHKDMLSKLMKILSKRRIRINPSFNKLIVSLRTATGKQEDLSLDKTHMSACHRYSASMSLPKDITDKIRQAVNSHDIFFHH